jgi:hypothetical protein
MMTSSKFFVMTLKKFLTQSKIFMMSNFFVMSENFFFENFRLKFSFFSPHIKIFWCITRLYIFHHSGYHIASPLLSRPPHCKIFSIFCTFKKKIPLRGDFNFFKIFADVSKIFADVIKNLLMSAKIWWHLNICWRHQKFQKNSPPKKILGGEIPPPKKCQGGNFPPQKNFWWGNSPPKKILGGEFPPQKKILKKALSTCDLQSSYGALNRYHIFLIVFKTKFSTIWIKSC